LKSDEHPPHSFKNGEKFLKQVYNAVRSSPAWNETALLIIYDEHGGFYDHIPPPTNVPIPDDNSALSKSGFKFDRLGVRVPAILISPWVKKGSVVSSGKNGEIFEHSSVAATIKKMFGLDDFLTKRDAWAATFDHIFDQWPFREDCLPTFD
jgi:phospholipase C